MEKNTREAQKKIVRSLVKVWMRHRTVVIVAIVAILADIAGICLVVNAAPLFDSKETVYYEEAPAPVANVAGYSDIFGGEAVATAPAKTVTTTNDDGTVIEEEAPTVLELNNNTKPGYMNNCYFLGDSRLVAMVSYGFVSDANVLAKIGVSHTAVESTTFQQNSGKQYTVKQYLQTVKPPVVYVCYGVNGMNGISEERYETTYKELVEHIMEWAPDSKIVLMSIWPVDDTGPYKNSVQNSWIEKYNDFLLALAEYEGLFYLDVASVLKDSNGQIKPEFDGGDGLHYRASAYNTIIDYIYHHPVKGISDDGEFTVKYVKPSGQFKKIMTETPKLPANVVTEGEAAAQPTKEVEPTVVPTIVPTPTVVAKPTKAPADEKKPVPSLSPSPTPAKPSVTDMVQEPEAQVTPNVPEEKPTVEPTKEPTKEPNPVEEEPTPTPENEPTPEPEPTKEPEKPSEPVDSEPEE